MITEEYEDPNELNPLSFSQDGIDEEEHDSHDVCAICLDGISYEDNVIVFCDKCNVSVHQLCYGVEIVPDDSWFCDVCQVGEDPSTTVCELCSNVGGAYKPTEKDGSWVHILCASWIPECYWNDNTSLDFFNLSNLDQKRYRLKCAICPGKKGACIQCSYGRCTVPAHPMCALSHDSGFTHRIVKSVDHAGLDWEIFCVQHAKAVKEAAKPKVKAKRSQAIESSSSPEEKPDEDYEADEKDYKKRRNKSGKTTKNISTTEIPIVRKRGRPPRPKPIEQINDEDDNNDIESQKEAGITVDDDEDYVDSSNEKLKKKSLDPALKVAEIKIKNRQGRPPRYTRRNSRAFSSQKFKVKFEEKTFPKVETFPMLSMSEWPGQAVGEGMDLVHFWNVVSMSFAEDHNKQWFEYMMRPVLDWQGDRDPIFKLPPLGPNPKINIRKLRRQLNESLAQWASYGRDKLTTIDPEKRQHMLFTLLTLAHSLVPLATSNSNTQSDEATIQIDKPNVASTTTTTTTPSTMTSVSSTATDKNNNNSTTAKSSTIASILGSVSSSIQSRGSSATTFLRSLPGPLSTLNNGLIDDQSFLFREPIVDHSSEEYIEEMDDTKLRVVFDGPLHRLLLDYRIREGGSYLVSGGDSTGSGIGEEGGDDWRSISLRNLQEENSSLSDWASEFLSASSATTSTAGDLLEGGPRSRGGEEGYLQLGLPSISDVSVVPDSVALQLSDGKIMIPKDQDDEICRMIRTDMEVYRLFMESAQNKVKQIIAANKLLEVGELFDEQKKEWSQVEVAYKLQRIWKKVAKSLVEGMRDRELNFNQADAEAVPASWTVQVDARTKALEDKKDKPKESEEDFVCSCCFDGSSLQGNEIVYCDGCNTAIHQACFGINEIPEGDFYCDRCRHVQRLVDELPADLRVVAISTARDLVRCCLCPLYHGGLKPTMDGRWVHLCCAWWSGRAIIRDLEEMSPVDISMVPVSIDTGKHDQEVEGGDAVDGDALMHSRSGRITKRVSYVEMENQDILSSTCESIIDILESSAVSTHPAMGAAFSSSSSNTLQYQVQIGSKLESPAKTPKVTSTHSSVITDLVSGLSAIDIMKKDSSISSSSDSCVEGRLSSHALPEDRTASRCMYCKTRGGFITGCCGRDEKAGAAVPCVCTFHPICAWFEGNFIRTTNYDPSYCIPITHRDKTGIAFPASELEFQFYCDAHIPPGAADEKRSFQKSLRNHYRVNVEDLDTVPGHSNRKRKKKSKGGKVSGEEEAGGSSSGGGGGRVRKDTTGGRSRVTAAAAVSKDLNVDKYDKNICAVCINPIRSPIGIGIDFENCSVGGWLDPNYLPEVEPEGDFSSTTLLVCGDCHIAVHPRCYLKTHSQSQTSRVQTVVVSGASKPTLSASSAEFKESEEQLPLSVNANIDVAAISEIVESEVSLTNTLLETTDAEPVVSTSTSTASLELPTITITMTTSMTDTSSALSVDLVTTSSKSSTTATATTTATDEGVWRCYPCQQKVSDVRCALCPRRGGAFLPTDDKKWAHAYCGYHVPGATRVTKDKVVEVRVVPKEVRGQNCVICNRKSGYTIRCGDAACSIFVHPLCAARSGKYYIAIRRATCRIFCEDHLPIDVRKLPSGQWLEVTEFRKVRQSLDRARLIVDVVVKREKKKLQLYGIEGDCFRNHIESLIRRAKGSSDTVGSLFTGDDDDDKEDFSDTNITHKSENFDQLSQVQKVSNTLEKRKRPNKVSSDATSTSTSLIPKKTGRFYVHLGHEDNEAFVTTQVKKEESQEAKVPTKRAYKKRESAQSQSQLQSLTPAVNQPKGVFPYQATRRPVLELKSTRLGIAFCGQFMDSNDSLLEFEYPDFKRKLTEEINKTAAATRRDLGIFANQREAAVFRKELQGTVDTFLGMTVAEAKAACHAAVNPEEPEAEAKAELELEPEENSKLDTIIKIKGRLVEARGSGRQQKKEMEPAATESVTRSKSSGVIRISRDLLKGHAAHREDQSREELLSSPLKAESDESSRSKRNRKSTSQEVELLSTTTTANKSNLKIGKSRQTEISEFIRGGEPTSREGVEARSKKEAAAGGDDVIDQPPSLDILIQELTSGGSLPFHQTMKDLLRAASLPGKDRWKAIELTDKYKFMNMEGLIFDKLRLLEEAEGGQVFDIKRAKTISPATSASASLPRRSRSSQSSSTYKTSTSSSSSYLSASTPTAPPSPSTSNSNSQPNQLLPLPTTSKRLCTEFLDISSHQLRGLTKSMTTKELKKYLKNIKVSEIPLLCLSRIRDAAQDHRYRSLAAFEKDIFSMLYAICFLKDSEEIRNQAAELSEIMQLDEKSTVDWIKQLPSSIRLKECILSESDISLELQHQQQQEEGYTHIGVCAFCKKKYYVNGWSKANVSDNSPSFKKSSRATSRATEWIWSCSYCLQSIKSKDIIGRHIKVWWDTDQMYYQGKVELYEERKKYCYIIYEEDEEFEIVRLQDQIMLFEKREGDFEESKIELILLSTTTTPPPESSSNSKRSGRNTDASRSHTTSNTTDRAENMSITTASTSVLPVTVEGGLHSQLSSSDYKPIKKRKRETDAVDTTGTTTVEAVVPTTTIADAETVLPVKTNSKSNNNSSSIVTTMPRKLRRS